MKTVKHIIGALIGLLLISNVFGQRENNKDQTLRGSGRVNPSTLAMEFDLPLGSYPGRGINVPISLSYSSKVWRMDYSHSVPRGNNPSSCISINNAVYAENSASGWTTSLAVPYIEYVGKDNIFKTTGFPFNIDCDTSQTQPQYYNNAIVKRLVVHLPSGETHELRADDTYVTYDPTQQPPTDIWNATFYAVDSSNIKYIENSSTNTYKLLMPDGSYYEFAGSLTSVSTKTARKALKYYDRNGNFTTFNDNTGAWTDTLGRTLNTPLGLEEPSSPTTQTYSMPGMTGTYKFVWKQLKGGAAAESGLTNFNQDLRYRGNRYIETNQNGTPSWVDRPAGTYLFGSEWEAYVLEQELFNPVVLTEIELPTGQKYKFSYNIFGMIDRIKYPIGGEEQFTYSQVAPLSMPEPGDVSAQANFGVVDRKVLKTSGDTSPYQWTYGAAYAAPGGYKITINNPDSTKLERFLYQSNAAVQGATTGSFGYDNGLAGMSYEERSFDSLGNLASKNLKRWEVTSYGVFGGSQPAHWHPRVTHEENYIYEPSGNAVYSTQKFEYEGDLWQRENPVLQKKILEYGFAAVSGSSIAPTEPGQNPNPNPTPVPTPIPVALIRTTETTFLINDSSIAATVRDIYKNQNMVGSETATVVKDAAGNTVSRNEMKYDDTGFSPGYRGNPTTSRIWDSTKGNWDNPNAYIQTRARFDTYGNQYEAIDAKGNVTTTEFDSVHHAFPTKVKTPIPDPNGVKGSDSSFETLTTYNLNTGLPITQTDLNGQTTTMEYDPVTLRLVRLIPPAGEGISEVVYNDEQNNQWIKTRKQISQNTWNETITYADGLGRIYLTEQVNSNGNIFVKKEFDSDGRVLRVSNPYRLTNDSCYQNNQIVCWTTNIYDESSRVKEVILQDGSKIKNDFGISTSGVIGLTKQITDQAGKKRKGISDASGRMIRVIEDPDGQNLATDYVFDTLGNLRKAVQGEQSRYFTYDSLGRLLFSKQPEEDTSSNFNLTDSVTNNDQWSIKFQYDDNGNMTAKTDARGVTISASYDKLNRLILRDYSDSTPDVDFYYDGKGLANAPAFSKNKMTRVTSSVSETRYTTFNNQGNLLSHQQITDGQTYNTGYQYNDFGAKISETYPSGRTVKFDYDQNGSVSQIWGTIGSNNRVYAQGMYYNASGAIERMRLGNGKWESAKYNNRLQLLELGLGSSVDDKGLLRLEFGYGTNTQNNGSMVSQKISFNGLSQPFEQFYNYDDLNRLSSAQEKINNQTKWKQTFQYDRYGNRRFDANNTTTLTASNNISNPEISTSTNRFSAGQNYLYDSAGNLTQDALGNKFFYDAENQQKEIKNSVNQTVGFYVYDGEGRRVKKVSNTEITVFVYNGNGQMVAEYSTYVVPQSEAKISYLTQDHLGSPRIITDSVGKIVARKDYGAYGEETYSMERTETLGYKPENIRHDYTGYQKDDESGLEYAQARYYNTSHGRFTSVDPLKASANVRNPQTFNRYTYALNSPYKFTDPLGLISESTGACGMRCRNSGDYVDGSAFRGTDTSFGSNMTTPTQTPPPAPPEPTADQNADVSKKPSVGVSEVKVDAKDERLTEGQRAVGEVSVATTPGVDGQGNIIDGSQESSVSGLRKGDTIKVLLTRTNSTVGIRFAGGDQRRDSSPNPDNTSLLGQQLELTGTVVNPGEPVVMPFTLYVPNNLPTTETDSKIVLRAEIITVSRPNKGGAGEQLQTNLLKGDNAEITVSSPSKEATITVKTSGNNNPPAKTETKPKQ